MSRHSARPLPRAFAGLALLAVVAAACSGGANADPADDPTTDPTAAAGPTEPTPSPSVEVSEAPTEEPEVELAEAPDIVRGVYSTVYSFWGERWAHLVELVETTELNAVVVDVKDEAGTLLWEIDHPLTHAGGGAGWKPAADPRERLQQLLDAGGYPIARVACFKDTLVAQARPDLAVQDNRTGDAWRARKDFSWLNPYQDEAGQWCIDVGLAALEVGFQEVQFDYIRFPNGGDGDTSVIQLPGVPDDRPREQWRHTDEITDFLARASEQIHAAGGLVSADLFGLVTYDFTWDAQGTGQVIEKIAEHVDFISPMVYPSHYGVGNYGLTPHPIEYPYETVWNAMQEAQMRVQGLRAEIRPWLEDFSAPWMGYPNHSPKHVSEQIRATYENGIEGWLLWNAGNSYTESILAKGEAVSKANPDFLPPYRTANPDAPPGVSDERIWPGMPPCKPDRERLEIGRGNLAGSVPPTLAPGGDQPIDCKEEEPAADATAGTSDAATEPADSATEPADSATEADSDSAGDGA
jgi:hypothetical protein